jgi:hypothetical protein
MVSARSFFRYLIRGCHCRVLVRLYSKSDSAHLGGLALAQTIHLFFLKKPKQLLFADEIDLVRVLLMILEQILLVFLQHFDGQAAS